MRSFLRWLVSPINKYVNSNDYVAVKEKEQAVYKSRTSLPAKHMNFRVYPAVGGSVIQVDKDSDQNIASIGSPIQRTTLYIIADEDNFGEEIAKIITLEGLRR